MGNLCPCYGFVRTVLAPGFLRPGYHDQPRASRYPNEVIIDHSTVALASPALRHRCRIRLLHVAVIVVSVLAVIFDIAGRVIYPAESLSSMMVAIWIAVPSCIAASLGICSVSRYTTPYRRRCLFNAQYFLSILTSIIIIGMGIYMATEFQSYTLDHAPPVGMAPLGSTPTTASSDWDSRNRMLRTTMVIRCVELFLLLVLLSLCICSACVTGRELCPECGCDCDCEDEPVAVAGTYGGRGTQVIIQPVNEGDVTNPVTNVTTPPSSPLNHRRQDYYPKAPRTSTNPYDPAYYDYNGRDPQYPAADGEETRPHRTSATVPAAPTAPLLAETTAGKIGQAGTALAHQAGSHLHSAVAGLWNKQAKGPAPVAPPPPPPSYSEAIKD